MLKSLSTVILVAVLTACAIPSRIALGTQRDEVLARLGQPTRLVPLKDGAQRLQYSYQPLGQLAWMIDLDAGGRVARVRQVMTEDEFQRIVPGEWTRSDVEREFGPPGRWNGRVMTYRWRDPHGGDRILFVYVDAQDVVRDLRNATEVPGNLTNI